jgi:tuberculosinol/isotuberculosinol synthase
MLFGDGVRYLFVVGFGGGQGERNVEYRQNLAWVYEMLIDETTRGLYEQHGIAVSFRGKWQQLFERLGAADLTDRHRQIEEETTGRSGGRLIWYVDDDLIPASVLPLVRQGLDATGRIPPPADLAAAYYGQPVEKVDIFIGNNKPNVDRLFPPLLAVGDLYFTVSPSMYLSHTLWRHILYDHLYERRGHFRDYTALGEDSFAEMKAFYAANRDAAQGIGYHHARTAMWRPMAWPHLSDS